MFRRAVASFEITFRRSIDSPPMPGQRITVAVVWEQHLVLPPISDRRHLTLGPGFAQLEFLDLA